MKLRTRMLLLFLSIGVLSIITISVISIKQSSVALDEASTNQLQAIRDAKKNNIEGYFNERKADVSILSATHNIRDSLVEFSQAWENGGLNSTEYQKIEGLYESFMKSYIEEYGYYDLFLIDSHGNVIYTVGKEDDLGTNLVSGSLKDSGLGAAFEGGKRSIQIVDYKHYEPSKAPAAFLSAPVNDSKGQLLGVVALQISDEAIDSIMKENSGLGETGETYLIGADRLMRSDSRFSEEKTLGIKEISTMASSKVLNGATDVKMIEDYRGVEVLSAYAPLDISGLDWAIIAEIDVDEIKEPVNRLQFFIIGSAIIVLVAVTITAFIFALSITKPIRKLKDELFLLAQSGGDLTQKIEINRKDEIGELASATNRFIENIRQIVSNVLLNAEQVAASSQQLAASAEETTKATNDISEAIQQVASGSENNMQSADETARSMEEMAIGIQQIAESSSNVSETSNETSKQANKGKLQIREAVSQMEIIHNSVNDSVEVVQLLELRSKEIGQILGVITNIAEQTNLLALNAAIEAARAGESGKGFAVVADEIRKLAVGSKNSADQISQLVISTQEDTNKAIKSMGAGAENVQKGLYVVSQAGEAFEEIYEGIQKITEQIYEVSASIEQMSANAEEVSASIVEMASITKDSAVNTQQVAASAEEQLATMEEISSTAESLSKLAEDLQSELNKFEV